MSMPAAIDDISIEYVEEGQVTVKELDKQILTRGAWSTILFKYQEWDKRQNDYGPIKFSIRRYQKRNDAYRQMSKFNISNIEQAKKIIAVLNSWIESNE